MGSENLKDVKEIAVFGLHLAKAINDAEANDGKIGWDDLGLLFPLISDVGPAFADSAKALEQWKNASSEDRNAMVAELDADFSLGGNKKAEEKVEAGLAIAVNIGKLLS